MFGSNVLEVATSIVFIYLLLSLLCTTINEQVVTRVLSLRAKMLENGIKNMLGFLPTTGMQPNPKTADTLAQQVYNSPLIKGLSENAVSNKPRNPSYIPADLFAVAVMSTDLVKEYKASNVAGSVPAVLASIIEKADGDAAKEAAAIEKWFNDTMDRVSGWYKRRVQLIIFILGLVIVVGLNIDTLSLITSLSNDAVIRSTIVSAAQGSAANQANANLPTLVSNVEKFQPQIGWSAAALPGNFWGWILKIVGLLATTFAISLGSPFWFDVLNKFISFRASGPPPQPSLSSAGPTVPTTKLIVESGTSPNNVALPLANPPNADAQSAANNGGGAA
jgi:hypothetical protein